VLSVRESGNRDDLGDGHDPRLRTGKAEASTCFFLDLLSQSPSHRPSEKAKYALAKRVVDYVSTLAGRPIELGELYATNICNQFLSAPPKGAVVLIPDAVADEGVRKIVQTLAERAKNPRVIISMSQQCLYHLCRTGFLASTPVLTDFLQRSIPKAFKDSCPGYRPIKRQAFLSVCGQLFLHQDVPVVPVLHVSSYRWMRAASRYQEPMAIASKRIRTLLA